MVLTELGGSITGALQRMSNATQIDKDVLNVCLNDINRALLEADVQVSLVSNLKNNINKLVNLENLAAGHDKRNLINKAVFKELCRMLDPGKPSFTPTKGKPSVVMFVGLQGSGKTTTCTKYGYHHLKKGWRPALVCADAFRAGAIDQLKQNATKANIPFYGSYTESDPVKIAVEGVERFKKENHDLIIVDTSGRHMQEAALFEEMRQFSVAIKPDLIVLVMDSSIGQAAFDQARAFKHSVDVGAVIITKMDGHAKGGGALSAVAATKSPVIFIGTGEHMDEFEVFDVGPFVGRLLGKPDWSRFVGKIREVVPQDQQSDLLLKLSGGKFTLRTMYELYQNILRMGPIGEMLSMLGLAGDQEKGNLERAKMKHYMIMMDSIKDKELDDPSLINEARAMRIARGSGSPFASVMGMLAEYRNLAKKLSKNKLLKGGKINTQQMAKIIPPQMLKQLMKQLG